MAAPTDDSVDSGADAGQTDEAAASSRRPGDPTDTIRPIVAEIRSRVAALASRELTLRQREEEVAQQYRLLRMEARQLAQSEWNEAQERLRQRSDELDSQSVELAARRSELDDLEQELTLRQIGLEQAEQRAQEESRELQERVDVLADRRRQDRQRLRGRIQAIRDREGVLLRRVAEAHHKIGLERKKLVDEAERLRARATELEKAEQGMRARRAAMQAELDALKARSEEVTTRQTELGTASSSVQSREAELEQVRAELDEAQRKLTERQRELDENWRATRDERRELAGQAEDYDARRRVLKEREATLEQRGQRLDNYDQQLRARAAALEDEARRLEETETVLTELETAVHARAAEAEKGLSDVQRQREEVQVLREQAEAHESENRQVQLSFEVEREDIERQRTALAAAQEDLSDERESVRAESEKTRAALGQWARQLRRAHRSGLTGPRRGWLRSSLLGAAVGLLAATAWWHWQIPTYYAGADVRLLGDDPATHELLVQHERRLRAPGGMDAVLKDGGLLHAWELARAERRAEVALTSDESALRITVRGPDRVAARQLVRAVCTGYRDLAESAPEWMRPSPPRDDLLKKRSTLAAELAGHQQRREDLSLRIDALPSAEERERACATADDLRARHDDASRSLSEGRGQLSVLMSAPPPRGTVSPAEFATALATDEMYTEDSKELRATGAQFQSELAVAMLMMTDSARELRRVLDGFSTALGEQRGLQPPDVVATALDDIGGTIATFGEELATFTQEWESAIEQIQDESAERRVPDLVAQQQSTSDTAQKLCRSAEDLAVAIRTRLDTLATETDGGTRVVVVTAVLRDELNNLTRAVVELVKAGGQVDPSDEFPPRSARSATPRPEHASGTPARDAAAAVAARGRRGGPPGARQADHRVSADGGGAGTAAGDAHRRAERPTGRSARPG